MGCTTRRGVKTPPQLLLRVLPGFVPEHALIPPLPLKREDPLLRQISEFVKTPCPRSAGAPPIEYKDEV